MLFILDICLLLRKTFALMFFSFYCYRYQPNYDRNYLINFMRVTSLKQNYCTLHEDDWNFLSVLNLIHYFDLPNVYESHLYVIHDSSLEILLILQDNGHPHHLLSHMLQLLILIVQDLPILRHLCPDMYHFLLHFYSRTSNSLSFWRYYSIQNDLVFPIQCLVLHLIDSHQLNYLPTSSTKQPITFHQLFSTMRNTSLPFS